MPRYAAVDIGSNSLRMEAAEVVPGSIPKLLASDRQVTRLGASVFRTGKVSGEAMELVCKVLSQMAEQYRKLEVVGVRAVATSAIRDAANQDEFLHKASDAIGTPVEVISGQEESRLIHLGVQSNWPHPKHKVLLVDVGGGSAETMYSECGHLKQAVSKPLGAVRLTEVFLKSDPPTPRELDRMETYIEEKLASAIRRIGPAQRFCCVFSATFNWRRSTIPPPACAMESLRTWHNAALEPSLPSWIGTSAR